MHAWKLDMQQLTASDTRAETAAWKDVQIAQLQDPQSSESWGNRQKWQVEGNSVFHGWHWVEAHLGMQLCLQEDNTIQVVNYRW